MKIKKLEEEKIINEAEEEVKEAPVETEAEIKDVEAIDDVAAASTEEIADTVTTGVEAETNGEETLSDKVADDTAKEVKAADAKIGPTAMAPLGVTNELTKALDACLSSAQRGIRRGRKGWKNLLVTGLPGSGKTAIVNAWAKSKGLHLWFCDAKNRDLATAISGMPLRDMGNEEDKNAIVMAKTKFLDPLDEPNTILFLDELNRAQEDLRGSLLTLINEHAVAGAGGNGYREFPNLLFTVACINPAGPTDPGASKLNAAERSRFPIQIDFDSTNDAAREYFDKFYTKDIETLNPEDPYYAEDYTTLMRQKALAAFIFDSMYPPFEFDSREDQEAIRRGQKNMLNQRTLTDILDSCDGTKDSFLFFVKQANLLDKDVEMLEAILASYEDPEITIPGSKEELLDNNKAETETSLEDKIANGIEDDDDADLFASNTSAASTNATKALSDWASKL